MVIEDRSFIVDPQLAHRRGSAIVTVRAADGQPLANTAVTVAQRKHRFLFGCIGFEFIELVNGQPSANGEDLEKMAKLWFDVFNFATLPTGTQSRVVMSLMVALALTGVWVVQWAVTGKGQLLRPARVVVKQYQ